MDNFKIGDMVIGHQWPDLIPAKVIELVKSNRPLVRVAFTYNGKTKEATLPEWRLKKQHEKSTLT